MATTPRFNLNLITQDDSVNIDVISNNFEIIDTLVGQKEELYRITIEASEWTGSECSKTIDGIKSTTLGLLTIDFESTIDIEERKQISNAKIFISEQREGSITIHCDGIPPTQTIHLALFTFGEI